MPLSLIHILKTISIDIETYSGTDLGKCGVYKYAEDPDFCLLYTSLDVVCPGHEFSDLGDDLFDFLIREERRLGEVIGSKREVRSGAFPDVYKRQR